MYQARKPATTTSKTRSTGKSQAGGIRCRAPGAGAIWTVSFASGIAGSRSGERVKKVDEFSLLWGLQDDNQEGRLEDTLPGHDPPSRENRKEDERCSIRTSGCRLSLWARRFISAWPFLLSAAPRRSSP